MLIDWFTVGAQTLNFVILVWLMQRFLYRPILQAIDAREARIAAALADADAQKSAARQERDAFRHKSDEFDRQRAALFSQVTDEARAERQRLLDAARSAADAFSAKRRDTLRKDAENLNRAVIRRTQQEVLEIARKTLADLASTGLEGRMVEVFTRRVRELNGEARQGLAAVLVRAPVPAVVRSAFDLTDVQRASIQQALDETFAANVPLRFETAPELVGGIELASQGQKVAWSIADYLAALEKGLGELLDPPLRSAPAADVKTGLETPCKG